MSKVMRSNTELKHKLKIMNIVSEQRQKEIGKQNFDLNDIVNDVRLNAELHTSSNNS